MRDTDAKAVIEFAYRLVQATVGEREIAPKLLTTPKSG
jgi:hypothetical protein